jgi:hypothetical protein
MPLPEPDHVSLEPAASASEGQLQKHRWYHKVAGVMAAIFCFELGVFLLVYPWASDWNVKYFTFLPLWARGIWSSPYFRGAISGLGILNIYISFLEVFRLRRFSA